MAQAIAEACGVKAESVDAGVKGISVPVDLLFIGDGIYAGKIHAATAAFIEQLDADMVKKVAVFATYGGQSKIAADMKEQLRGRGLNVSEEVFTCRGKCWLVVNRNHPNEDELRQAKEFAKKRIADAKAENK